MDMNVYNLACRMHTQRCGTCGGTRAIEECAEEQHWMDYAALRVERRVTAAKGKFVKGKPKELTRTERRMEMGDKAKELKMELDSFIKSLIEDNLTLEQVAVLYNKMMRLANVNSTFKKSVCKE